MGEVQPPFLPGPDEISYRRDWQAAFMRVQWEIFLIEAIMMHDCPELHDAVRLVNNYGFTRARLILLEMLKDV